MAKGKKTCFVIAPIGEEESEVRKRSDQILKYVIEPPATESGYDVIRADKIEKPGIITSQVIQHVVEDQLVIADLSGHNANVFYELAIRHAIQKPLIQLIQKGERIPFDVAGTRTISVDHHSLDSVAEAKAGIAGQIKSLEDGNEAIETPISVTLDLQTLRKSGNPEQRSLADIMATLSELPTRIEERLAERGEPVSRKKSRRYHPMMIEEMTHMLSMESADPIGVLVVASLLREDFPWLYEIGLETYRAAKSGTRKEGMEAMIRFQRVMERTVHGPFAEEFASSSKETYRLFRDLPHILESIVERYRHQSENRKGEKG